MIKKFFTLGLILFCTIFITGFYNEHTYSKDCLGTSDISGVSLYTEQRCYSSDSKNITVVFKNITKREFLFGEIFGLQKLVDNEWKSVNKNDSDTIGFFCIAYSLKPHSQIEYNYNTSIYTDNFESGIYRITTEISYIRQPGDYDNHLLTANFIVES